MNIPASAVIQLPHFNLEEVEQAIYLRNYEKAGHLLLTAMRKTKQGALMLGYSIDPRTQKGLYSRLTAAMISLFADPKFMISQNGFDHFASEHAIIDIVVRFSVFDTTDHMLPFLSSNPTENDRSKLHIPQGMTLIKFLLTYSLRSGFGLNFEETFSRSPQATFSLWAGMISPLLIVAKNAEERREILLGLHTIFTDVDVPDAVLPTLSDAYMYSSYGLRRDKHDMKATVHKLFAKALHKRGVKLPGEHVMRERRKIISDKPTILICVEWFSHLHAMFRCYAPIIRQLRKRFRLVCMSRKEDIDEEGKAEFDEWFNVSAEGVNFQLLVAKIVSDIRPDIIYYPSLGMGMWWVVLASVRLAPIQVMTLGHPASSRSPVMDYVICETDSIGDPSLFTERIVTMPSGSARFILRPDAALPEITRERVPATVHVAIPAMLCKLNASFMGVLRQIGERCPADRKVVFHFFINMIGVNLFQAKREILDWLPDAIVHERFFYPQYMVELSKCHAHLCTFPFGGTNSNMDSMLLGIPLVSLEGDQPHERFDASMIRRAGLPSWLIASTREEYVDAAAKMIFDDEIRNALSDQLNATDLTGAFFEPTPPDRNEAFLEAMEMLYEHHEALQASEARVINIPPHEPRLATSVADPELQRLH